MEFEKFELGEMVTFKTDPRLKLIVVHVLPHNDYKCIYVSLVTGVITEVKLPSFVLQHSNPDFQT